jgi:hypothetical protein
VSEPESTADTRSARPRRRTGVAGAAVGDLLVRLEAQIFRSQPTAQLQVTRTDEVTAQTSDGPLVVAFPPPLGSQEAGSQDVRPPFGPGEARLSLSDSDRDEPADRA